MAKDYKRIGHSDKGQILVVWKQYPDTFVDSVFDEKIDNQIIKPTIEGLKKTT